ncbi:E3 ubiquitin-protein ligase RNF103-like isoform X2 [Stegodyphus dumicola]|nr:E3 ubiquitin-protein ligase RNF103-like isoform X2 [Stegodyphus dumicola]XP_035226798.1 E3 ubiquitin-protein ligase RNF103-like isoform X2 [Stegodyphus dumicola]
MSDDDPPLLSENTWKQIFSYVSNFGVRTGIFRCSLDSRLCSRKGWISPRLILALPKGYKAKEDVIFHNYLQHTTATSVLQWVRKHLASRVKEITSEKEIENWMKYSDATKNSEIRLIFFSILKSCPMFLSSLAIKFNGRVKFGTVDTSKVSSYKKFTASHNLPVYLVITPEKTYVYGSRHGECYNFKSMELFLRTFVPEVNDVFLWSLLLINALASFELFFMYSQVWKHFLLYVVCIVKYNCLLFLFWLTILALYQFPFTLTCTHVLLKFLRIVSGSYIATVLRSDYKNFYSYTFLLVTFVMFASIAGFLLRKFNWIAEDNSAFFSNWWFVPREGFPMTYFFRPMATLTRPLTSQDMDLEVGMELLIERLAVPNLWLQPVISMDYIKDLPVWKYQGWCEADDAYEDNKGEILCSSDDESANLITFKPVDQTLVPKSQTSSCDNLYSELNYAAMRTNAVASQEKYNQMNGENMAHLQRSNSSLLSSSSLYAPKITEKSCSKLSDADRAPKGMLEFRECSICLESYRYGEILCGLPCGHNFHMNCIMSWLSRDNHCCPICRWPSYKAKNRMPHSHFQ